jgi:hypothetical protein
LRFDRFNLALERVTLGLELWQFFLQLGVGEHLLQRSLIIKVLRKKPSLVIMAGEGFFFLCQVNFD